MVETVLLYGLTAWTLTQSQDKKLDGVYTKMPRVMKNVTWWQRITNGVLYAGLPRISTTVRERRLRFNGHSWRSKYEVVRNFVLWEPTHDKRSVGGQAHTFVDMLEVDTGVPRDCFQAAMDNNNNNNVLDTCQSATTWIGVGLCVLHFTPERCFSSLFCWWDFSFWIGIVARHF